MRERTREEVRGTTPDYSPEAVATISRLVGMSVDDPALQTVITTLFRARRQGKNLDDDKTRRELVAEGKRKYRASIEARDAAERDNWIYYLRVGDLVKVGTAQDVRVRVLSYPPNAEVLAVEPGSYRREAELHQHFAEYLSARNEWFEMGPRLADHIDSIRDPELLARLFGPRRRGRPAQTP